jgi:hypothetical protein
VLSTRHVIEFVAEVTVPAVGEEVDENGEQREIGENRQVAKEELA